MSWTLPVAQLLSFSGGFEAMLIFSGTIRYNPFRDLPKALVKHFSTKPGPPGVASLDFSWKV